MRLNLLLMPLLFTATQAFAQATTTTTDPATPAPAPTPVEPAPAPATAATPVQEAAPAPTAPDAPHVERLGIGNLGMPVQEDPAALENFARDCWTVDGPVEGRPALAPAVEFKSYVRQKKMGALSRRAVYNTLGARQRLSDVEQQEEAFFTKHRVFQQIIPAIVGLVLIGVAPAMVALTIAGVAMWLATGNIKNLEQTDWRYRALNFFSLGAAIVGIPLAIALLIGAVPPLALAVWRTVQLQDVQPGFLVDGNGFSTDEATRVTETHNQQVARQLGLHGTPVCSDH